MFDTVHDLIEQGEALTQSMRPGTVCVGRLKAPATFGRITFSERLGDGGFRVLRSCHVRLLRQGIPNGMKFERGDAVTITLPVRGGPDESFNLNVSDSNSSSASVITLNLEADAA